MHLYIGIQLMYANKRLVELLLLLSIPATNICKYLALKEMLVVTLPIKDSYL